MFRRPSSGEPSESPRGPGGGKIRNRAPKRARRPMGILDYVGLALLGAVIVFVVEKVFLHAAFLPALAYALIVAMASIVFNYWLEQRRVRNAPPPKPKRRR